MMAATADGITMYGVDGVFMQRFVVDQKWPKGKAHHDTVLDNAMRAARKYERAVCIMYDLTGMKEGDTAQLELSGTASGQSRFVAIVTRNGLVDNVVTCAVGASADWQYEETND